MRLTRRFLILTYHTKLIKLDSQNHRQSIKNKINSLIFLSPKILFRYYFLIINFIFLSSQSIAQELIWTHTGGPMGGIIGGMDINSNGDIYAGVYPFIIPYTGLFKSTDNGENWFKVKTQFEDFQVFTIYITNEDHIWVGTDYQDKLYRSTDNGLTWEIKANGYDAPECWAIVESKDGVLFAGDANSGQLYRSTNDGEDWQFSADIAPLTFAIDSNNVVYAGTFNGLYSSTDNGLTWTKNNFLIDYAIPTLLIDTSNGIYCGTGYTGINGDGLFYSSDGGQFWKQLGFAGKVVLSLAFDSECNLYTGTLEDGLFKTTDLGQSWIQYQNGIYRKEVYRLVITKKDDIFIGSEGGGGGWYFYGGGGVFRSTNGGELFEQVGLPISLVKNIVFSGDSLIISSSPSGVQKYNRFTKKWRNLGLHNVEAVTITPSDYLYAATRDDGLYKSTDLGEKWFLTNLTIDTLMPVYNVLAINDDTLFASTFYNLRRSTDGGENWNVLPISTGDFDRGLFFNDGSLWVTGVSSSASVLYRSSDFGNSFDIQYTEFETFDSNNPISVINNGYVFLASALTNKNGIYRSTDFGMNWNRVLSMNNNWPTVYANDDGVVFTASLSFYDTSKIYISSNFGNTWTSLVQPTDLGVFVTAIIQDNKENYFFGTSRQGLYEVDILTDFEDETSTNYNFYLSQNYPNPFNSITKIRYSVPISNLVQIKLYNILGIEILTLLNEYKRAGTFEVEFDGSDISSGVYFYRITCGRYSETKKMLLLK